MNDSIAHLLVPIMLVALIAWRMHARVRRLIGRQPFTERRTWVRLVVLPVIFALLVVVAFTPHANPLLKVSLVAGAALGGVLGFVGLRLTRFEVTPQGLFYTPNAHLGIALSVLLVARIAWRFYSGGFPGWSDPAQAPPPGSQFTPLTALLIATILGYYCAYAIGLIRWAQRNRANPATQPTS